MLDVVNKRLNTKSLLTMPSNVLPLHLKQTFLPIIWIFTEGDWIESSLPFRIFSTITNVLLGPLFIRRDLDSIPCLIRWLKPSKVLPFILQNICCQYLNLKGKKLLVVVNKIFVFSSALKQNRIFSVFSVARRKTQISSL